MCKTHGGILRLWHYSTIVAYLHWESLVGEWYNFSRVLQLSLIVGVSGTRVSISDRVLPRVCILSQALNFHTYRSHRALLGTRKCQHFREQSRIDLGEFWWIQLFLKDKKKIDLIPIDVGPGVVVLCSKELAGYEQLLPRVGMHILYFVIGPS